MKHTLRNRFLFLLFVLPLLFAGKRASASHLYGADFYYTWNSGTNYTITLVAYGDCGGSSFPFLNGMTPEVQIFKGTSLQATISLAQVGAGVEVTPVCPSQATNTKCSNLSSTIPGVKRYIYQASYTLGSTATNWRFHYTGNNGASFASSGRSNSITNISNGTTMQLDALLNNTVVQNSSVNYTTIPTPFFCINKAANFNPGAVDPNNDSLAFALVSGLGGVSYVTPYTATAPLATSAFSFATTTGQMNFTPNAVQQSLVVMQVNEYKNGVLVGTSMREMTLVVLNTCNNNPPTAAISNPSTNVGSSTSTTLSVCNTAGIITFNISPTDADGDKINVQIAGLPPGATFSIFGNNGFSPVGTFTWDVTNVTPGTYNFFITLTDNGCSLSSKQTLAYTITVYGNPQPGYALVSAATCAAKARYSMTPFAGNSPYSITVTDATITHTFTGVTTSVTDSLAPGTYTIHTVSALGCTYDTTITIAPVTNLTGSFSFSTPTCYGGADGSISVSGVLGTAPYTYALGAGSFSSTSTFSGLSAGSYLIHIKDAGGCTKDTTVILVNPAQTYANVTVSKPPCNGFASGSISVSGYNTTAPYTYAIGSGAYGSSGLFTGLASGPYTVHIKNALGCIKDTIVTLPDSVGIQATATVTNALCFGNTNGTITVSASGAYPPYTYAIGSGSFTGSNVFNGLAPGSYVVHVRDSAGCYFDTTIIITQPTVLTATASTTANVSCNNGSDGVVSISGSGGTPPYTYSIGAVPFGTASSFSGLSAGTYTLTVKDANNCTQTATATVTQPTAITVGWSYVSPNCSNSSDGSITISGSGGTPGYTYAVDATAYQSSGTFNGLAAGTHALHVKDANGCIKDTSVDLPAPARLTPGAALRKSTCATLGNGQVTLSASGGTPGYTYAQGTGAYGASAVFAPLAAGSYTLHVKDTHGCISDTTITISDSLVISGNVTLTNVVCYNQGNGSITVVGTGGIAPYTYALGSGAYGSSGSFTPLANAPYILHIKDANGCIKDTNLTITQPTLIVPSANVTNILCNGGNGVVTISATGGIPAYTYAQGTAPFVASGTFTNVPAGCVAFHVKDANNCVADTTICLTQPAALAISLTKTNVLCNGGSSGTVTITGSGGVPAYTYAYDANAYTSSNVLTGISAGIHTIHLKDANGCIKDTNINVTEPAKLAIGYTSVQPLCNGDANGSITISGSGGTTPYLYSINSSPFSAITAYSGLSAGTYVLHIKDANNCTKDSTIVLGEPTALAFTFSVANVLCNGGTSGSVTVTASGGTPAYSYAIDAGAFSTSNVLSGLSAGLHTVHLKDANNCIKDSTITITQPAKLNLTYSATQPLCNGGNNGSITITGIGGTTPYTFALNSGIFGSASTFSGLSAGVDTLHIKDANGCTKDSIITLAQPALQTLTATKTNVLCNGGATGTVTVTGAGGITPYSYAYDATAYGSSNVLTGLTAGIHTIHLKDVNGCIKDTNITITEPTKLVMGYTSVKPLCNGDANGSITISANGGTTAYLYSINTLPFTATTNYTGLAAGTYVLHIKDANNCTLDSTITLSQPAALGVSLTVSNVLCNGGATGSVSVVASGGTPAITYAIDAGAFGSATMFSGLTAGLHTVHLKDANNCIKDTTFSITQPAKLNLTYSVTSPLCNGGSDGSITITGIGGTTPYTFAINSGAFGASGTFNGLSAGIDTLHIKDANGCTKDSIITLSQPPLLTITATKTNVLCNGGATGTVTVTGAGGITPYTYGYDANPYGSSNVLTGLTAGIHTIHLKDVNGCVKDTNITITEPAKLVLGYTSTKPLCNGDANGTITIAASGGTPGYTYSINTAPFSTSPAYTGLGAGTYVLHLKDANGCTKDSTITLSEPAVLGVTLAVTNVLCNGNSTASVTATATGGTAPYTYALNTGAFGTSATFSGLAAGIQTVHIKDANNCIKDTTFTITQPAKLNLSYSVTNPLCNGGSNGSITITGIGGTTPYTFALNSGAFGSSGTFTNLSAGTDTLHIKDANGCTKDSIIVLGQPAPLAFTLAVTNVLCNGGSSATITVTASGGVSPYTYAVDGSAFSTSTLLTGLNAGTHTVHLKDVNGCVKDSTLTITEPPVLSMTYTLTTPLCNADANGSITISGTGGKSPYTYSLNTSPYGASGTFSGLAAGTYTLHVKDANNCIKDSTITISQPAPLAFTFAITPILCNGDSATVTVTASGGTTPYTYAANAGAYGSSNVLTGLPAGTHIIHLKDANGCIKDSTITLTQPNVLRFPSVTVNIPLCYGDLNGSIVTSGAGGVPPYTFSINSGAYGSSSTFTGLGAGLDTLHIKDANGCITNYQVQVTQPAPLAFTLAIQNVLCNGGNTGQVTISAAGGTAPYQYAYGTNAFGSSNVLTGFAIGTYTIHLKDANGCIKDTTITITQPAVLGLGYTSTNVLCYNGTTGTITMTGVGGTTPYSFALNAGAFQPSGAFTGLAAGTYVMHIKDANGCTKDSTISISQPTDIYANAAVKMPRCTPLVNGAVTIYAGGGTPGYTYAVGAGAYSASNAFNNLASGIYTFHIKDANGCVHDTVIGVQDSVFVHVNYTVTNVTCFGGTNGSVSITPSGGDPAYTFAVNTAAYSAINPINNLPAGSHVLHVKDANGCILDTALIITQPPVIQPAATITQPLCNGGKTGTIQMVALGGTPGYTFALGTGAYGSSGTFSNLGAGTYTIHTKDANGCVVDATVVMLEPPRIVIDSIFKTDLLCFGDNSGTSTVYASGGTPGYSYGFDANGYVVSNILTGFTAGNHTIHVKDVNGCIKDTILNFKQPAQLHFTLPGLVTPTCEGMKDGSITIAAIGGTRPYLYAMDAGTFKPVNIYGNLGEGSYVLHVKDSNNCTLDTTITLTGYPHIVLGQPEITPPTCNGFNNGIIDLNVSGGVQPLTYHIIKPDITNNTGVFDTLRKGTYKFQIVDAKGCRKDTTLFMDEPDKLIVAANATPNDCEGVDNNGAVGVSVQGGTQPYAYTWSSGQTSDIVTGIGNGAYWVTVVDANLCADSALAVVGYNNCCKPFLPDAFTPNGDGKNDIYRLRWKGDVHNLNFSIYNRFGERVFVSYQADFGWDGTYHGKPVDMGVYFYDVKFDCGTKDGNRIEYKGDVTLIR